MNSTYDAVFKVIETDVEILAKAINQAISDSDEVQIINDFLTELKSLLDDANNEAVKIMRTGTDQQDSIIERLKTLKVLYRTICNATSDNHHSSTSPIGSTSTPKHAAICRATATTTTPETAAATTTTTAATLKDHHPTVTPTNMDHRITAPIRTTGTSNAASSNINLDKRINDEIFARRNAIASTLENANTSSQ